MGLRQINSLVGRVTQVETAEIPNFRRINPREVYMIGNRTATDARILGPNAFTPEIHAALAAENIQKAELVAIAPSLTDLQNTYVHPLDFAKEFVHDRFSSGLVAQTLVSTQTGIAGEPTLRLSHKNGYAELLIHNASCAPDPVDLSRLGNEPLSEQNVRAYQRTLYRMAKRVFAFHPQRIREEFPQFRDTPHLDVLSDDCCASWIHQHFLTDALSRIEQQYRVMQGVPDRMLRHGLFGGRVRNFMVSTLHGILLMAHEAGQARVPTLINVGSVSLALDEHLYLRNVPALEPQKAGLGYTVADMGVRSAQLKYDSTSWGHYRKGIAGNAGDDYVYGIPKEGLRRLTHAHSLAAHGDLNSFVATGGLLTEAQQQAAYAELPWNWTGRSRALCAATVVSQGKRLHIGGYNAIAIKDLYGPLMQYFDHQYGSYFK